MVDTPRTAAYLTGTSFPETRLPWAVLQDMRDLVVSIPGVWTKFNVLNYGAKGDGTTDDTAAFVAAAAAAASTNGMVYCPTGNYLLSPNQISLAANVSLVGEGFGTNFKINGGTSGYLIDLSSGASAGSPNRGQMLSNFMITGNGSTGVRGIRGYYIQNLLCHNLYGESINGGFCSFAQIWDSRFHRIEAINCSNSTAIDVMLFQNSAAASGSGFSADTTNQCYLSEMKIEVFLGRGIAMQQGPGNSAGGPNGMYFSKCKLENETYQGQPLLYNGPGCTNNSFRDFYFAVDTLTGGSAGFAIENLGGGRTVWDGIQCNMGAAALCTSFIHFNTYGVDIIESIMFATGNAPSVAVLTIAGNQPIIKTGVVSWATGLTAYTGAPTAAPGSGSYYVGTFIRNIGGANMATISGWLCTASGSPGTWRALA